MKRAFVWKAVQTLAVVVLGAGSLSAQCPELLILTGSDAGGGEYAGQDVALLGDLAVMGAPREYLTDSYQGAVYVYRFDGTNWNEEAKLTASDAAKSDYFGTSVATDGTRIAVGVPKADVAATDSGAVYIYQWNGSAWVEERKVSASTGAANDHFGTDVAIDGNVLLVGVPEDDLGGTDQGSVICFRRHAMFGWTEDQQFTVTVPANYDKFGYALSLDDRTALIGAPQRKGVGTYSGMVFVFKDDGTHWSEDHSLQASDATTYDEFGSAVAVRDGVAVIGAPEKEGTFNDEGGAYIFEESGGVFTEITILTPPLPNNGAKFGYAVATDGEAVVVGAPNHDVPVSNCGAMYSYVTHKGAWAYDQVFLRAAATTSDYCGYAVAVDHHLGMAGTYGLDLAGSAAGGAIFFSVDEFMLTAVPPTVNAGDTLTFDMYCGTPLTPSMFCVIDVGGSPFFFPVFKPLFASNHHVTLVTPVPSGLAGIDIGFMAFRFDAFSRVLASNSARVYFQ